MPMEYERVFLVKELPDLSQHESVAIEQHYLSHKPQSIRIRRTDNDYELTKKIPVKGGDDHDSEEINIPLRRDEFLKQRRLSVKWLTKRRYFVPIGNQLIAEVNVFAGRLQGLLMIEVEFNSPAAKKKFVPPAWFGREVTKEGWAKNSWLAGKTFTQVKKFL